MSKYNTGQSTINILNTLMQCSYPSNFRDFISNVIAELSNSKGCSFYKVNRTRGSVTDTIIVVKYLVSTMFNLKTYDIPVLIYINKSFPYEAPEIYLERAPETGVNPKNTDIDTNTFRITTGGMKTWNQFSTIPNIIAEINISFNKTFPIYKLSTKQVVPNNDSSQINSNQQVSFNSGAQTGSSSSAYGANIGGQTGYSPYQYQNIGQNPVQNPGYGVNVGGGQQTGYNPTQYQGYNGVNTGAQPTYNQNPQINPQPNSIYSQLGIGGGAASQPPVNLSPEEAVKRILIEEIMNSIEGKIKDEVKKLKQQEEKLTNYKNEFLQQIDKYQTVLNTSDNIQNEFQNTLKNCEVEINSIKNYLAENSGREITSQNFEGFIKIGNQNILRIVAIEATIEDIISILKKAFEREILSFEDSVKFIRNITREATKIKYYRDILVRKAV